MCQRKSLMKLIFFEKNIILFFFLILSWDSRFLQKLSTRFSKPDFSWTGQHLGRSFSGRRYNFISFQGFSLETLTCKKTPGSSNRHSTCPAEHFEEKILAEMKLFDFWALSEKKPVSWRNSFGRVVNFALHVSRATLLDKKCLFAKNKFFTLFSAFEWRTSSFSANVYDNGVKTER